MKKTRIHKAFQKRFARITLLINYSVTCFLIIFLLSFDNKKTDEGNTTVTYYIDSKNGNDKNSGNNKNSPWKTLSRLSHTRLRPGDSLCFKRGSSFTGPLIIHNSGNVNNYIVVTDYGSKKDPAPSFTNPVFSEGNYGNCIRVKGSYIIIENLFFWNTAAYRPITFNGEGWVVWEMGAIHIERGAEHCIIRNNEIKDCVAGIRSNGEYAIVENNYIHDCNRVLKEWNWGPLGIWLGADHQEVCYNKIFNYNAVDPRIGWGPESYGSGADGGAIEIDDARYGKSDISIHHNYTKDCQGFLEVTWTDVKQRPSYKNFRIHHNVSDDYQQFIALWWGKDCRIENNTVIRRKINANEWGVFNITQPNSHNLIRNNIVVTENDVAIFNLGRKGNAQPKNIISNNLYYAAKGKLNIGKEGPGDSARFEDPLFKNYEHAATAEDFSILTNSPAINMGIDVGYEKDFAGTKIPQNIAADIGAFEYKKTNATALIRLAKKGKALVSVHLPINPSTSQKFAAQELRRYLSKITNAYFPLSDKAEHRIIIRQNKQLSEECYTISLHNKDIVLAGGSERAVLYSVYDFLHRLGCRWLAPQFDFYDGSSEYIPKKENLSFDASKNIEEHPQFAYRKIDVEEGRSHTIENLKQIVDWMPKVRFNILMVPLNYQGGGRVKWENWREALTPELKKRGLLIEVGGHGYQNFLNAKMENGALFKIHPEWFGKNKNCKEDTAQYFVFNTSNSDAIDYFTQNILSYLKQHPEIDIFDFWPPDGARWAECPEFTALGSPVNRQAVLVNKINAAVKKLRPDLRLEIIAYGQVLLPPGKNALDSGVLVDVCPINQSFEKQIFDTTHTTNAEYAKAILNWRSVFPGDIGLYSYYRKYAWRSLPVIIPHYIQNDLKWYSKLPLQGISTYAEPGDWYTYELNHYSLANLAWNPDLSLDSLINEYCFIRYGSASDVAENAYNLLEEIVPTCGSIPFTTLKSKDQIAGAQKRLFQTEVNLRRILNGDQMKNVSMNLSRLQLMINYAVFDFKILQLVTKGAASDEIESGVKKMIAFLEKNSSKGVFLISGNNKLIGYSRHYTNRK